MKKGLGIGIADFKIEYKLPDVKSWYDGYKFGNSEVYNPWNILNFLQHKELEELIG